jgi:hypothetical protein
MDLKRHNILYMSFWVAPEENHMKCFQMIRWCALIEIKKAFTRLSSVEYFGLELDQKKRAFAS